ncbi:MAG: prepilin-type N-terminal cleavage/methylation domain-containing protein, partial [Gammaproteobacteria bacterium]|nr:prepilin-type N-terminal cleavage/methylation domain-containing protein [Gammaproteobacteria bacterium]
MRHMRHYQQSGLSLIELMIAMAVGLILLAGVLSIFISSRQGYSTNSAVATVQENGRFALDFIRDATRQAGYMG